MFCTFEVIGTNPRGMSVWKCPQCEAIRVGSNAPKNRECGPDVVAANKPAIAKKQGAAKPSKRVKSVCAHRGASLGETPCKPCQAAGKLSVTSYECSVHQKCTERNTGLHPKIQACSTCPDYQPLVQLDTTRREAGPIRVALIAPALHNPGGIERWLIAMSRYLPLVSDGRITAAVWIREPSTVDPDYLAELSLYAKVQVGPGKPVAAHAAIVSGMGEVDWCLSGFQGPIVWVSHGCCEWGAKFCREAMAAGRVTHWASVGHASRDSLPVEIRPEVTVLENGAEVDRCTPVRGREWQRKQWGIEDDQIVIGFVGRLCSDKRPLDLASAIKHLPKRYVGIAIGEGIHAEATKEQSYHLVGDRVRFVGRVNLLGDALAGCDLGFLTSPAEGFCLSRTEMGLAGLPMVSTQTGELPRLEGLFGKLTFNASIGASGKELAEVIDQTWRDRKQLREVTERARKVSWAQHTATAMAGRWADYLTTITR